MSENPRFSISTAVAWERLSVAQTLVATLAKQHPQVPVTVMVVDAREQDLAELRRGSLASHGTAQVSPVSWLTAKEATNLEPGALHRLAICLGTDALTAALVPHLLRRQLDGSGAGPAPEVAIFASAATWVFGSLEPLALQAREEGQALLPRARRPPEQDRRDPSAHAFQRAGLWDDGLLALAPGATTDALLKRWVQAVDPIQRAGREPSELASLDAAIATPLAPRVRSPVFNVSRWNLHERSLTRSADGTWAVEGLPLVAVQLPGFDPRRPYLLAAETDPTPRTLLSEHPALASLCRAYAGALESHRLQVQKAGTRGGGSADNEVAILAPGEGAFETTADGIPIDARIRRICFAHATAGDPASQRMPDPFDEDRPLAFSEWLRSPSSLSGLPRYLEAVYAERPDLHAAFPDAAGAGGEGFLAWVQQGNEVSPPIPKALVSSVHRRPESPSSDSPTLSLPAVPSESLERGVNLVGYLKAESGVGEIARSLVAVLEAARIPYSVILFDETRSRQDHPFDFDAPDRPLYDTNIFCINADQLPVFRQRAGRELFESRTNIGIWAWEVDVLPEAMRGSGSLVDHIWGISTHTARCIEPYVETPVAAFPLPIRHSEDTQETPESRETEDAGESDAQLQEMLPEGSPLFLFCFDFDSVFERKNPVGLVEAFRLAFPDPAPEGEVSPRLLIKTINGDLHLPELEALRSAIGLRPDIRVVDHYLSANHQRSLMRSCDVYVSLHRAEGFGLTLAEAMALGKPVVATAYSANLDFMSDDNSYLIPYELIPVGPGAGPYPSEARWAKPSLEAAASAFRKILYDPEEATRRGRLAQSQILDDHSPAARSELLEKLIQEARRVAKTRASDAQGTLAQASEGIGGPSASPPSLALAPHPSVDHLLQRGPELTSASAFGAPARWLRRGVLRLIRNYHLYIQDLFRAMSMELHGAETRLHGRLEGLERSRVGVDERFRQVALLVAENESRLASVEAQREEESYQRGVAYRQASDLEARLRKAEGILHQARTEDGEAHTPKLALADQRQRLDAVEAQLAVHSDEMFAVPYSSDPRSLRTQDLSGRETLGYRDLPDLSPEQRYLAFEEIFRGPEPFIRDRQRLYLEYLLGAGPVVDIGCGRGEMLELLAQEGAEALGVDLDSGMVRHCRAKGLQAVEADGVTYLEGLEDRSLGAIFCSQVVEHLSHEDLQRFLELAWAKLGDDGVLVFETVNPHSLRAFKAFWLDPTHERPIFPETAVMLCRFHAFETAFVVFPNGTGIWSDDRKTEGEYAVIAYPRSSPEPKPTTDESTP